MDGRSVPRSRNRVLLLRAASELFASRGYRGTATKDIAEAAGITERTLFRHFPTKAAIFRDAVITPVDAFVADFTERWKERPQGSRDTDTEVREFYENLVAVIDSERHLLVAVIAALSPEKADAELFPELRSTFAPLLDALTDIFAIEADLRGWDLDPAIAVRLIVGMALSVTVHSDWLFAGHEPPSPTHLVDQLTRLTVWGLRGKPA